MKKLLTMAMLPGWAVVGFHGETEAREPFSPQRKLRPYTWRSTIRARVPARIETSLVEQPKGGTARSFSFEPESAPVAAVTHVGRDQIKSRVRCTTVRRRLHPGRGWR